MDRNHKIFKVAVESDVTVRTQDPEAPGSGEMVNAGTERAVSVYYVVAVHEAYVMAWAMEPYRFKKPKVKILNVEPIAAVIEVHTY